jgi:ribose transport system ATP-binding protein
MKKDSGNRTILQARSICKDFPGVRALDNVNLDVYCGCVNAIVGENGAGKSTLMKILSGIYTEYEGRIVLNGEETSFRSAKDAQEKGIAIIHQELNLVPGLSVAENVFLGNEFTGRFGLLDYKKMQAETSRLLKKLAMDIDPAKPVSELRIGQQQVVEIAKALSCSARILIMDEPTSAVSDHEVEVLFDLVRSLTDQGVSIIYITHKLEELFQLGGFVTVLRDGKQIGSDSLAHLDQRDIVRMMVGRDIRDVSVKTEPKIGGELLRVEHISLPHPSRPGDYSVHDISFSLKKGEVLGFYGLMGAGRTELFETVFGLHPDSSSGKMFLEGEELRITSPKDAVGAGIGFITENRKDEGLVSLMSVAGSISLASIHRIERFGFLSSRLERSMAEQYIRRLAIKTSSEHQAVETLSGGNQQKVVIAKWLATDPKILFLDEPTRGIDVNARNEIYLLIRELASSGLGIAVVSSELPEVMAVSDRIIVLSEGEYAGEFTKQQATEEKLVHAALPKSA